MNAQQQVLEYANKNNDSKVYNEQQFVVEMSKGGIVINRTPSSKTIAKLRREGKTLIITETTITETTEIVDGKAIFGEKQMVVEVLRAEL